MKHAESSKTQWPTIPAHPVNRTYVWYLIAVLAGILYGMAKWGPPGGGV